MNKIGKVISCKIFINGHWINKTHNSMKVEFACFGWIVVLHRY